MNRPLFLRVSRNLRLNETPSDPLAGRIERK